MVPHVNDRNRDAMIHVTTGRLCRQQNPSALRHWGRKPGKTRLRFASAHAKMRRDSENEPATAIW
jgi:hypothetical protein